MIGGNHGRAAASSTSAATQASSLCFGGAGTVGDGAGAAADRAHHVAHDLEVELALAAEVVVEHRLVDAGARGDAVGAGGVVAALGELERRGAEDGGAGITHGASRHRSLPPAVLTNRLVTTTAGTRQAVNLGETPSQGPPRLEPGTGETPIWAQSSSREAQVCWARLCSRRSDWTDTEWSC